MHPVLTKISGLAAYLAFIGGLAALCVQIAGHTGAHALALAAPYTAFDAEQPLTLVERRRLALETSSGTHAEAPPLVPDPPAIPLDVLAANLDEAEQADLMQPSKGFRRSRHGRERPAPSRVAAADVFGRSFGVLVRASR